MADYSDPDFLEGECAFPPTEDPVPDRELDLFALFADVLDDPDAVEARRLEWLELFGETPS